MRLKWLLAMWGLILTLVCLSFCVMFSLILWQTFSHGEMIYASLSTVCAVAALIASIVCVVQVLRLIRSTSLTIADRDAAMPRVCDDMNDTKRGD